MFVMVDKEKGWGISIAVIIHSLDRTLQRSHCVKTQRIRNPIAVIIDSVMFVDRTLHMVGT